MQQLKQTLPSTIFYILSSFPSRSSKCPWKISVQFSMILAAKALIAECLHSRAGEKIRLYIVSGIFTPLYGIEDYLKPLLLFGQQHPVENESEHRAVALPAIWAPGCRSQLTRPDFMPQVDFVAEVTTRFYSKLQGQCQYQFLFPRNTRF